METSNEKVNQFIQDCFLVDEDKTQLIIAVQKIFFKVCSEVIEDIKYGGIVYLVDDELASGIFLRKNHISIEFGNGSELPDPDKLLEGTGKFRRHLKLKTKDDIAAKKVEYFINQSLGRY
ncbi:MAG: DUF1801 domain-containing protein [Kangiellaceae bacterium]